MGRLDGRLEERFYVDLFRRGRSWRVGRVVCAFLVFAGCR